MTLKDALIEDVAGALQMDACELSIWTRDYRLAVRLGVKR